MPAGALSAIRPASILSSGRQPSSAARAAVISRSTLFTRSVLQPVSMLLVRSLRASSMWVNQSCVMNWIQNAAITLKNGAFW